MRVRVRPSRWLHHSAVARSVRKHRASRQRSIGTVWMLLRVVLLALVVFLGQVGPSGVLSPGIVAHAQGQMAVQAGSGGIPNTFHPDWTPGQPPSPLRPSTRVIATQKPQALSSIPPAPVPMRDGLLALSSEAAQFLGSDKRLEVDVPAGAVTSADIAAAQGGLYLRITQVAPASGSNAGGSGHISLGMYLLQLVDGTGVLVPHGLRKPVTLILHVGNDGIGLDLAHAHMILHDQLPAGARSALPSSQAGAAAGTDGSIATTPTASASAIGLSKAGWTPTTYDPKTKTLSAQLTASTTSSAASFDTNSAVATFGRPDPFGVDLSVGGLTGSIPIDLPPGPGGFTPPLSLTYSSASVSQQHNPQAPAPWVGEGWNLALGSISWSEHSVSGECTNPNNVCTTQWENTWELTDPYGTGAQLIPPNINVSTYYDSSGNPMTPTPIQWHTSPETHAKIYAITAPFTLTNLSNQPTPYCFRVFLANGIQEEFGCTPDSLQYYPDPSDNLNRDIVNAWYLDLIIDPQGNQIHIHYQTDTVGATEDNVNYVNYPRDVELGTIEYDSPSCHDALNACTGSAWTPLVQVTFSASRAVAHPAGSTCPPQYGSRCDGTTNLSGNGGDSAPMIQNSLILNDMAVQTRTSGTAGWNTLHAYQFGYEQTGEYGITDPVTGLQEQVAGELNLTRFQKIGSDGTTTLPPWNFSYTSITTHYEDQLHTPTPSTNCGPPWNTGRWGTCILWSTSQPGNSNYLSTVDNGLGMQQSFLWKEARNDTHGDGGRYDPLYCDGSPQQSSYPCNEADDGAWSIAVLTQRTGTVEWTDSTTGSTPQPRASTTYYQYIQNGPTSGPVCADCDEGMYWGDTNDHDYLDFYNTTLMGFQQMAVTLPDSSKEVHHFNATVGYGIYDANQVPCDNRWGIQCYVLPWASGAYAGMPEHGREAEVDTYDTDGTTLLAKTVTQYQVLCPPSGVGSTPAWTSPNYGNWNGQLVSALDRNNPVAACDVQKTRVDQYTYDGASGTVPQQTTTYAYDSYGRVTQKTVSSNGAGSATGSPTSIVTKTQYIQNDNVLVGSSGFTNGTHYLIDFAAFSDTEDTSGNRASCTYTSYDGQSYTTGQSSSLTGGLVTTSDTYTNCGTAPSYSPSGLIRTTYTYDASGNQITTNDPDANAGSAIHQGCWMPGTPSTPIYSTCETFDSTFDALSTGTGNALNQWDTTSYEDTSDLGGFGWWPTATTDKNGQTTTYSYDALGRMVNRTQPGEGAGLTTSTWTYTVWCAATGAQTPCIEIDQTQRLNSSDITTTRAFYDGYGRLVETRASGPGGQDVVSYRAYDKSGRVSIESNPYFVTAYTGAPGTSAYSVPDLSQPKTATTYDGLGRVITVTDALSYETKTSYSVQCSPVTGDSACYEATTVMDPLLHQRQTLTDSLGRQIYGRTYTGTGTTGNPYAVYTTITYAYDLNGNLTKIVQPDGTTTTTFTYDAEGRKTGMTDPDRGTETYTFDADGNRIQAQDAGGAGGTVYAGYDALDRQVWRNTSNNPAGAFATYTYDASGDGNAGISRLTSETFTGGSNGVLSGSYARQYDARGQLVANSQNMQSVGACPTGWTCGDIGGPGLAGTQTALGNGTWTITGGGYDIWNTSDQFHYVWQSQSGDGSVSAEVNALQQADPSTKAGVMWRASTDPGSPYYAIMVFPRGGVYIQYRSTQGGTAQGGADNYSLKAPLYLKVTRSGTSFSAYTSSDGSTWTQLGGSTTIDAMSGTLLAGIAISSHDNSTLGTVTVSHITPTANPPSTVSTYTVQQTHDDAGNALSKTYPDGEVVTNGYTAQGWLGSLSTQQGTTTSTLADSIVYNGAGGASHLVTQAALGGGIYRYNASYDALLRLTDVTWTRLSDSATLFEETRSFDGAGNLSTLATTLPSGTDSQAFCYDEQDRVTWAGSTGTPPCTGTAIAAGTLSDAQYTHTYAYDILGRLTTSSAGSYTYGDPAHVHAATAIGSNWTASYDASGNMTCRAPTSSTTCSGTSPTGAQLGYDAEGRLTTWQNTPSSPSTTDSFLYDGEGNRVEQQVTSGLPAAPTTTTTTYIGDLEEISTDGTTTTTTTYYTLGTQRIAVGVNGTISYLATDGLGSSTLALNASGTPTASMLYTPYGNVRYSSGSMPGSYGFTGQHADGTTGLDYYVARYYDPVAGQFVSADPAGDGLDLYAYVKDNPETLTDPSGLMTVGACGGVTLAIPGLGAIMSGCVVGGWDPTKGWSGGITYSSAGPALLQSTGDVVEKGLGVGFNVGPQITNAPTVDDLAGPFAYVGVGGSLLDVGLYANGFGGKDSQGSNVWGIEFGWQSGLDFDIHAGVSNTKVLDFSTIGSWIAQTAGKAKDWFDQQVGNQKHATATPSGAGRVNVSMSGDVFVRHVRPRTMVKWSIASQVIVEWRSWSWGGRVQPMLRTRIW